MALDIDGTFDEDVLAALQDIARTSKPPRDPNRVELAAPGREWVEVYPLVLDDSGSARQASLGGGWHQFPRSFFTVGRLDDVLVPATPLRPNASSTLATNSGTSTSMTSPFSIASERTDLPLIAPSCR
jgi:hypothetical protein